MTLPTLGLVEILDELERQLPAKSPAQAHSRDLDRSRFAVAFDADGTIWDGDVGIEAFERLVQTRDVRPEAATALRREAARFGIEPAGDPNDQAALLLEAFVADKLELGAAFSMMAWAFAGRTLQQMHAFATAVVGGARIEDRRRAEIVDVARWSKAKGMLVWVVSASPEAVIRASLDQIGFPVDGLVAMTPTVLDGVLQPSVCRPIPYAEGKVVALAEALGRDHLLVAAFGDSASDVPLLSLARVPVAVRPQVALIQAAVRLPSLVELRVV